MKIIFIGDIFGSPGRSILEEKLHGIIKEQGIDLVIANAENSAHGKGITEKIYSQIMETGVEFMTMGNHTWDKPEYKTVLEHSNIVRPMNLKEDCEFSKYGVGSREINVKGLTVRITNMMGNSTNMSILTNPFITMKNFLGTIKKPDIHIVDFHAESTSEKYAFFWAFNGQVDAILGTHTHVPTNDACITHEGTAFLCDAGMTGPSQGIIGAKRDDVIKRFFNPELKFNLEVQKGPRQLCAVIMEFCEKEKKMVSIVPFILREGFEFENANQKH